MQPSIFIQECGPLDNLKSVEISFPQNKNVAIMLSSGADSAVLLYLICLALIQNKRIPEKEICGILTIPKVDGAEEHAGKIVNWINQKLNLKLPEPIFDGPPDFKEIGHREVILKSMLYLGPKYNLNYAFIGDQQAVPEPYKMPGVYPLRVKENTVPEYLAMPFLHLDKSHTIDLHYRLNTAPLLELSHSCTQQRVGRCGLCYHCNERQWAFERLGKIDPGQN